MPTVWGNCASHASESRHTSRQMLRIFEVDMIQRGVMDTWMSTEARRPQAGFAVLPVWEGAELFRIVFPSADFTERACSFIAYRHRRTDATGLASRYWRALWPARDDVFADSCKDTVTCTYLHALQHESIHITDDHRPVAYTVTYVLLGPTLSVLSGPLSILPRAPRRADWMDAIGWKW